jgi:integrase
LQVLKRHAEPHLAWVLEVNWNIPVRPGKDLFKLRFNRIDYEKKRVLISHGKVKKAVYVRLSDAFIDKLKQKQQEHKSGYVIEYKGRSITHVKRSLKSAADKAGVPINCLYELRHLWITTAVNNNAKCLR